MTLRLALLALDRFERVQVELRSIAFLRWGVPFRLVIDTLFLLLAKYIQQAHRAFFYFVFTGETPVIEYRYLYMRRRYIHT